MMRALIRPIATLLLAVGVATCSDIPIAAVSSGRTPAARAGLGRVALSPVFSKTASYAAQRIADFGIRFDSVRILIRGTPDTTVIVKDTTVFFDPNSPDVTLEITVPVQTDGQRFNAGIDYRNGGGVVFHGSGTVQSHRPDQPAPPQQTLTINYVGPGARVRAIAVSPKTSTLLGAQSAAFTVTATDSTGASTSAPPINWSSSSATIAIVSGTGIVQGQNRRGSATITAVTPTGVSDNATVSVILPTASIAVVSGAGQTGKAGAALANPAVVQVSASDGVGVAGVNVVFAAPAGGSVGASSATTDASGRASTTLRLGSAAGPQSFAATAAGFSTAIPAIATAADPAAIVVAGGNGQTDSVRKTLAPISVRVTDSFTNPVGGATVAWARTSGSGSLAAATTTTTTDGVATNTYTLGSTVGPEGVSASIAGATAAFSFTATAGGPAAIALVSGNNQTGRVNQALASALVVRVTDAGGNPVNGAPVSWSATNGSIAASTTTDASGQTSATMTLGTALGAASATARIANGQSVGFAATVQPGVVSQLAIITQPANGTAGTPMSPVRVALRDAGGNATAAINAVTIALGNNPGGATLSGTLTRAAVAGTATFDDLALDKAGTGYTLVATSGNLPPATSTAFNVAANNVVTQLLLVPASPTTFSFQAGVVPTNPPLLKTANSSGVGVGGAPVRIVGTRLVGAIQVPVLDSTVTSDQAGLVSFSGFTPTTAGSYTLTATSTALPNAPVTIGVTILPGPATQVVFGTQPSNAGAGASIAPPVTVLVLDRFGNLAPVSVPVTIGVVIGNVNAVLSGNTANSVAGVATFPALSLSLPGTFILNASTPNLAQASSNQFIVVAR